MSGSMLGAIWDSLVPGDEQSRLAAVGKAVEELPAGWRVYHYQADDGGPWWVIEDDDGYAADGPDLVELVVSLKR